MMKSRIVNILVIAALALAVAAFVVMLGNYSAHVSCHDTYQGDQVAGTVCEMRR